MGVCRWGGVGGECVGVWGRGCVDLLGGACVYNVRHAFPGSWNQADEGGTSSRKLVNCFPPDFATRVA